MSPPYKLLNIWIFQFPILYYLCKIYNLETSFINLCIKPCYYVNVWQSSVIVNWQFVFIDNACNMTGHIAYIDLNIAYITQLIAYITQFIPIYKKKRYFSKDKTEYRKTDSWEVFVSNAWNKKICEEVSLIN